MIVALLSLAVAAADPAATTSTAPAAAAPTAAPAPAKVKEKKICKVDDADSGSHMVRRICLTEQEWQQRGQGMTNSSRSGFSGKADDH
jgi:predicted secreted protein